MKLPFFPDDSSWGHVNRGLTPLDESFLKPTGPISSPGDMVPADWLDAFAAPEPELYDLLEGWDAESEPIEPEPGEAPMSLPQLSEALSAAEALAQAKERQRQVAADRTDVDATEHLVAAFLGINGAIDELLTAADIWRPLAATSDLKQDYYECISDHCEELDAVTDGISSICNEVLADLKARLSPDRAQ